MVEGVMTMMTATTTTTTTIEQSGWVIEAAALRTHQSQTPKAGF